MIMEKKPLIILAVTVTESIVFFKGQITFLRNSGFEVAIISSPGIAELEGASFYPVNMKRDISPFSDMISIYKLCMLLWKLKPQIINYGTPKAGLLISIAAFITRIPIRIYTCHGLRLETLTGLRRVILYITEVISVFFATKVICVSDSLRRKLVDMKIIKFIKTIVIRDGSCNGVDIERFRKQPSQLETNISLRRSLLIPEDARIIGFVGRITKDKGIKELIEAFNILKCNFTNLYLLICGDFEKEDTIKGTILKMIKEDNKIIQVGFVSDISSYFHLMEVVLLPTYREGFGNVLLEANASGKPVIASKVTGCIDAVIDGVTGYLIPVGSSIQLAQKTEYLLNNPHIAIEMGNQGRNRAEKRFSRKLIWNEYREIYYNLLDS